MLEQLQKAIELKQQIIDLAKLQELFSDEEDEQDFAETKVAKICDFETYNKTCKKIYKSWKAACKADKFIDSTGMSAEELALWKVYATMKKSTVTLENCYEELAKHI